MMAVSRRRRAINYDPDTSEPGKRFTEAGRVKVYRDIRDFFESHGFEHRQGSGYCSLAALFDLGAMDLITALYRERARLYPCVAVMDVTNIGAQYDLHSLATEQSPKAPAGKDAFDVES